MNHQDLEKISELIDDAMEKRGQHSNPSPATLEMINELKVSQTILLTNLDNLILVNKNEHALMLAQTTKTNGTVASIQRWRYTLTGGMVFSNIIIIPIVIYLIGKLF